MTSFKTRKSDGQVFPTDRKVARDSGSATFVGVDTTQIKRPKNPCAKRRELDNPYEIWDSPDGKFELRVLKKNQIDDDKPYASYFTAVKSPFTFGSWEYGDMYVKDIKSGYAKRQRDDVGELSSKE